MIFLTLFATFQQLVGDLFAVLSLLGTAMMLLSLYSSIDSKIERWGVGGLLVGILGQLSIAITGVQVDKIGFMFRFPPEQINGILLLSFAFLILRGWLRSTIFNLCSTL